MVSKKVVTVVFVIAILLFAFSIIMTFSNSNYSPKNAALSDDTVQPDVEQAQVSIIVNKPAHAPASN